MDYWLSILGEKNPQQCLHLEQFLHTWTNLWRYFLTPAVKTGLMICDKQEKKLFKWSKVSFFWANQLQQLGLICVSWSQLHVNNTTDYISCREQLFLFCFYFMYSWNRLKLALWPDLSFSKFTLFQYLQTEIYRVKCVFPKFKTISESLLTVTFNY